MEPCAPGTEDEPPIMYSTLTKQENEQERLLSLKAFLRNGRYDNVFELSYQNGAECWFCKVCECPVMGRVFQHEIGKRHSQNLESTNRHMDKDRRDEPASEPVTLDIAPGEPVPPGFEDEVIGADSLIQERLDGFKAGPLVALEYLLELQDDDPSKEPIYLCILCDKKGDPRTVLTHLASYNHISQYLQKHFPTCWRLLVPYMTKQYKRNYQITLQKIGEGIEKKFGRLKPYPIDKDKFEKDRMHYLQIVGKGRHFSEQSGYTFEELVVHDELTKTYEDTADKTYETSTTNNWGNTTFIQKPFKKRSPSPPVVGAPRKKANKGNAQTNPRRQEPAYVPLSQQQQQQQPPKPQPPKQQPPQQQTGAAPAGRPAVRGGQRSRRSASSVSSISSSDLSEGERRNDRRDRSARNNRPPFNRNDRNVRNDRNNGRGFGRNIDRNGRLPYSRRRSPSPQRRQPSPRRRSPSPKRRTPSPKRVEREKEAEKVRKMEEFKKLGRAIENDMQKTLKQHEKNPEKHPQYSDEWKQFWNRRYKELKAEGVDVSKYDFKPEWIEFWNKRMVELHSDELRSRKEALRRRLGLDEINPIKFKIGGGPIPPAAAVVTAAPPIEKASPKRLPMAAQPDQNDEDDDDEVIFIDDKEDEERIRVGSSRSRSPWEKEASPVRRKRSPPRAAAATGAGSRVRRRSRERSPVRPARRSRSKDRYPSRSKSGERNISRDRTLTRAAPKVVSPRREPPQRLPAKDLSRDRDYRQSRERGSPSPASSRRRRSASPRERRSRSRERSWERREAERKRLEYRESSFERDLRGRERVRTVADLPWEREKNYRRPYEFYEPPPMMMREATRMPVLEPQLLLPPEDDDDEGEVNVVDVLRILTALEERLGSLGPKVIDLLAQALALEKKEANSSETLLDNDINCVMFETIKEKLKGQMLAGLVDMIQERAFKKAIRKIAGLIHLAGQRKRQRDKLMPRVAPVRVAGVGAVDKAAIAKQIAAALIVQGKTDVTQGELETLINAVVGMAEASKNSNKPMTTAGFLQQLTGGKDEPEEKIIIPTSAKKLDLVDLGKLTEPLTPSPGKTSSSNMENLSDSDLQTLLQNFKDLSTDEQHNLINYLKKLEYQEPERVERLRKFVNLDPTGRIKDETSESKDNTKKEKGTRESPFSNRFGSTNPMMDNLTQIESDEEDMDTEEDKPENKEKQDKQEKVHVDSEEDDYTFEDVVKTVSKTVKDKEIAHSKKIVEESMKFGNKPKPGEELSNAKSLISSLMSNISNSGSIDLLGLGTKQPNTPTTASSIDLTKLGNFSVASLASIMSNVNSTASTEDDKKLNFEPPSPTRKVNKLNIDPAQLERPNSPSGPTRGAIGPDRGFTDRGPLAPERIPERGFDRGFNLPGFDRAPDRSFGGPDRSFGGPDRSFGGPDRGFGGPDRSFGGPERGFGGPDRSFGGQDRPFGGPDRSAGDRPSLGPDRSFGGPDRSFGGPDRSFGGPDRSFSGPDRAFAGPDRSFGGSDRSFGGPDRSFGGPDSSFGGRDRMGDLGGSFGGPDRSDRTMGGQSFGGPAGPNRGPSGPGGTGMGPGGPGMGPAGQNGPNMGPAGQSGPNMGPRGPVGQNVGARGPIRLNLAPRGPGFGNDMPNQRLPRPVLDQRNNPRFGFGGSDFGRNSGGNFNRW